MRPSSLLAAIALVCLAPSVHASPQLSADERAAFAAVRKKMPPGATYALNLGAPDQYAYVRGMLRLAGATEALAAIEAARTGASEAPPTAVEPLAAGQAGALNVIEYLAADTKKATVALLSTVPGGTSSTTMMVSLLLGSGTEPFAVSPQYQQVNNGRHFVETFSTAMPANPGGDAVTASALFIVTLQGVPKVYSMMTEAGPGLSTARCVTGPNYGKRQAGAIPCPRRGASCTTGKPDITVCFGRSGKECNYVTDAPPTKFPFTIAGTITFPAPVDPALVGSYQLDLQVADGACAVTGNGKFQNPLAPDFFSVDKKQPNVLRYCIPNTALPPSRCVSRDTRLYLALTVYARVTLPDGGKPLMTAVISSDPAVADAASLVTKVPVLKVIP
jgi:hypothetical protein